MQTIPEATEIVWRIATWFRKEARTLPWRSHPTPYHVLLSELMLQQTRVETVVPYFERFVKRWPDLAALAAADEEEVLREWAGLGYYSRARNLHRCAVVATAAGGLPADPASLRALPGIGPYTAGAIASIAFGVRAPIVDGNVERVLCRIDQRTGDPRKEERALLWRRAEALLAAAPGEAPGVINQALMELGALVCTPRSPRCTVCPVGDLCRSRGANPEDLPRKAPKPKPVEMRHTAVIAAVGHQMLLGRRAPGLLGGLWEPLRAPTERLDELSAAVTAWTGAELMDLAYLGEVVHVFTHRRLYCAVYEAELSGTPVLQTNEPYVELRCVEDPEPLGLSALARRVLAVRRAPRLPLAAERP